MQATIPVSSTKETAIPFKEGKYTGKIEVSILKKTDPSAAYIRAVGERISLECFQGQYLGSLKKLFGSEWITDRQELRDLTSIFGSKMGMKGYGESLSEEKKKIEQRIERDASRPYRGDMFTGFAVIDNENGKIIGRVSLGSGYEPGESQSGLIIEESYRGKGYGKEAVCIAAALAFVFYQNQFQVGPKKKKAPVNRFTASALNSNKISVSLITKVGLKYMRSLNPKENYSDEPRSLYGVEASEVDGLLEKLIDRDKFSWEVLDMG